MQTYLRKYGVQTTLHFTLFEVDGVDFRIDAVDAGSDCSIMKNEGAEATCTNDFVDEGKGYSLVITATEMQAAEIMVYIVDSATKVWLDEVLKIETYGHASAMHAMDLDDAVRGGMTALPNAAADAAGGLPISDTGGLDLDAILVDTAVIGALGAGLTAIPWNSAWDAEVQSECKDALEAMHLDHLLAVDYDPASKPGVATALLNELIESDAGISRLTTNALEQAKGTNSAALASVATETRLAELDAANLPTDIAAIPTTAMRGTDSAALATALSTHDGKLDTLDTVADGIQTDLSNATDGLGALKALIDAIKAKTDNQPAGVPKNVALSNFMFLMMDSTDHITPITGRTIVEEISKDGGAFAACTNTFAEVSDGMYKINFTQAEMNADIIVLKFTASGADDRLITIITSS